MNSVSSYPTFQKLKTKINDKFDKEMPHAYTLDEGMAEQDGPKDNQEQKQEHNTNHLFLSLSLCLMMIKRLVWTTTYIL